MRIPKIEKRSLRELREDYEIEKELANKLRTAGKEERQYLYTDIYDEFYQRVPRTPQLSQKKDIESQRLKISSQMRLLRRFLNPESTFLEVGPGDCSLSFEVAGHVRKVYAVDVSKEITKSETVPEKFELIICDGCNIPVAQNSIDVIYSDQLMEHLHTDDAFEQLQDIYKALKRGGVYICITPNRLLGPHDISRYFDKVAMGFHLKEYTATDLCNLFQKAGFSKISSYLGGKGNYIKIPLFATKLVERLLMILPFSCRKGIFYLIPARIRVFLNTVIVGEK